MTPADSRRLFSAILLATLLIIPGGCESQPTEVVPLEKWSDRMGIGTPADPSHWAALRGKAPANHVIADQQSWAELWKAWRGDEPVPEVDFRTEIVIVYTCYGPNYMQVWLERDGSGNVKCVRSTVTGLAGPSFGYVMLRVNRAGIKSVEGHPIRPKTD